MEPTGTQVTEEAVRAALRGVRDPEIDHSILELGMLREIEIEGDHVWVHVVPTSAACPFAREIVDRIKRAVAPVPGVRTVEVEWGSIDGD